LQLFDGIFLENCELFWIICENLELTSLFQLEILVQGIPNVMALFIKLVPSPTPKPFKFQMLDGLIFNSRLLKILNSISKRKKI